MYVHASVRTYASASARVSGGDCRIKNNAVEGKGRGNGKVWWGLKKARDDVRKEETGDVYSFVVILRVCTRKISIRNVSAQANENASVLVLPLLRVSQGRTGNNITRGKRRYKRRRAMSTWLWNHRCHSGFSRSAEASHPFKCLRVELTRSMGTFPSIVDVDTCNAFRDWEMGYIYGIFVMSTKQISINKFQ